MTPENLKNKTDVDSTPSSSMSTGQFPELDYANLLPPLDDPKLYVNRELSLLSF